MSEDLPPAERSQFAAGLTQAAERGEFALQVCDDCGAVQYPPREACRSCLSVRLEWRRQDGGGELIAATTLRHSNEPYFRRRLPWRIALVRLDVGPVVIVHLHRNCVPPRSRVRVRACIDKAGQAALVALPPVGTANLADDPIMREMICR